MFSVALLSLMLPIATPAPATHPFLASATRASATEPSIRVALDRRDYEPGDEARVTVTVRDDGYLLVLRLSPDGYARVLFPLDPGDDNFVRGNGSYEIRGRGDRDAFAVSSSSGTGTVYAAWSSEPFRFNDYVLGDHWDYRVLDGSQMQGDPEAALTDLARRMSTGHFDYDLVSYTVARQVASSGTTQYVTMYPAPYPVYPYSGGCYYSGWCGYGSYFSVSVGFGFGRVRSAWYDPFYDPYFNSPYYFPRRYYRSYPVFYGCYGCGYRYPRVIVVNQPRYRGNYPYEWKPGYRGGGGVTGVQYRPRIAHASPTGQQLSPLYQASKFRRVAERGADTQVRRRTPSTVFGAPLTSGSGSSVGTARRTPGQAEVFRGGVRGGPTPPRRAGESDGVIDLRDNGGSRVAPRVVDGAGSGNSSSQRRSGIAEPRRAEPIDGGARRVQESGTRAEPRRVEPRSVEPRSVEPRSVEPRSVQPRSEQPRSIEPRSVQPRSVEPRSVEPRSAEPRQAPQQREVPRAVRSEPRSAPREAAPRSAPAPRVSEPRASQPRSAPAPRGRRP